MEFNRISTVILINSGLYFSFRIPTIVSSNTLSSPYKLIYFNCRRKLFIHIAYETQCTNTFGNKEYVPTRSANKRKNIFRFHFFMC